MRLFKVANIVLFIYMKKRILIISAFQCKKRWISTTTGIKKQSFSDKEVTRLHISARLYAYKYIGQRTYMHKPM